jgi:hypothetical protein
VREREKNVAERGFGTRVSLQACLEDSRLAKVASYLRLRKDV